MLVDKRDSEIKMLFKQGYSVEEIAKTLHLQKRRVLRVLKHFFKPDKEKDFEMYYVLKHKTKAEIINIYRKNNFYDSFKKI